MAANNLDGNTAMKMSLSVMSRDHKLSPQLPFYYFHYSLSGYVMFQEYSGNYT